MRGAVVPVACALALAGATLLHAAPGEVLSFRKISRSEGAFTGPLFPADHFGSSIALLGDLDSDGVDDIAVGAQYDDDGPYNDHGAVWILFLEPDGSVKAHQKLSDEEGGLPHEVDGYFGSALAGLGDLDGDGIVDLAVGAPFDGTSDEGTVWILFLHPDGTVKSHQRIDSDEGDFGGDLQQLDLFGTALARLPDLDGDGLPELAVSAPGDDDGAVSNAGALWILFLHADGTVKAVHKISNTAGQPDFTLDANDFFGSGLAFLGDLDGDGAGDLAVGAPGDDDGGPQFGAVWILFLRSDGTLRYSRKISDSAGELPLPLGPGGLGRALAAVGDVSSDGVVDLAVGRGAFDDGGPDRGAVWILFLDPDGTVNGMQSISDTTGAFDGVLDDGDMLGSSLAFLGSFDASGLGDLAVGAWFDDDRGPDAGGLDRGAVWLLFLTGCGNGMADPGEACDDANANDGDGCDTNCTLTGCGNGIATAGEQCDDRNDDECDGCASTCTVANFCGDGTLDPSCGEECDDGNNESGDGCAPDCFQQGCGNGFVEPGERCDDGDGLDGDGCDTDCTFDFFTEGKVYYRHGEEIRRANLDGTRIETIAIESRWGIGIALDPVAWKVYWTTVDGIRRSDPDGANVESFLDLAQDALDLTIDTVGRKVYWAECNDLVCQTSKIRRANLDGSSIETLIDWSRASDVALDVAAGKLYFGYPNDKYGWIYRANLDGSSPQVIVDTVGFPWGIDLDLVAGKVYWTAADYFAIPAVWRANLDGSDVQALPVGSHSHARDVALDEAAGKLYFSVATESSALGSILRANLDGSSVETIAPESPLGIYGLALLIDPDPVCGDGSLNAGEICDHGGESATCDNDCTPAGCGDGKINFTAGEQCDDANSVGGDGCENDCSVTLLICGNGIVEIGEFCDDGNNVTGDGCSAGCKLGCGTGVVPFGQTMLAQSETSVGWPIAVNVLWVRGDLETISTYDVVAQGSASLVASIPVPETPAPGAGSWWLVRVDCPLGTWSSGGPGECVPSHACPPGGRDGALP